MKSFYNLLTFCLVMAVSVVTVDSPLGSSLAEAAQDESPLRYSVKKDQKFAYKVKISAELPRSDKTYTGMIRYEVEAAGNSLHLECTGELNSNVVFKEPDADNLMLSPLNFNHPLTELFTSLRYFNTKVEIAPDGKTLKVKGSKHTPFLLGDIATLVFERLDESRQDAWTLNRDMAVAEVGLYFRGFAPFMQNSLKTVSSADEKQSFKLLKKRDDGLLDFEKTYRFETVCDEGKFILDGKGVWTFNQKLGISESLKIDYELMEEKSNISVKVPLVVEYTRVSDEELAEYLKKKEEEQKQARQKNDKYNAPVTEEDQKKYIEAITSGDESKQRKALHELFMWRDKTPNPALADAIRPLAQGDSYIANLAKKALANFCIKARLKEAYYSTMPLKKGQEGRPIRMGTKLPKGLLVAVQRHPGSWYYPARVVGTINENEHYVVFNSAARKTPEKILWSQIYLAPPELEQAEVSEADLKALYGVAVVGSTSTEKLSVSDVSKQQAETKSKQAEIAALKDFRTWTDDSGTFQVVAKYITTDEKSVELQREDGRKLKVPLDRLSKEDQKVIERLQSLPSNPFESNPFE